MATSGTQAAPLAEAKPRPAIDILEALLKWGSFAYALGFLTVLFNTVKLRIPTLELIEPVQVWVGVPVAVVFWLVIAGSKYFSGQASDLRGDLNWIKMQYKSLGQLAQDGKITGAAARLLELAFKQTLLLTLPFVPVARVMTLKSPRLRWSCQKIAHRLIRIEHFDAASPEQAQERFGRMLTRSARILSLLQRVWTAYRFLTDLVTVSLLLALFTYLYIFVWYPKLPQSWGGGAPMRVSMVLLEKGIPAGDSEIAEVFPQDEKHASASKSRRTKPLDLLYATQDAYYVRLNCGKIARFNTHAVSAMIFESSGR